VFDEWLDLRAANRSLETPSLAQIVVDAIRFFAEDRYDLYAYVVMPSHFHWLWLPRQGWVESLGEWRTPRERITYSVNRFTSTQCNRLLNKKGPFWQKESYDHWVRDMEELERIIRYIEENPVKAGLAEAPEEWPFSSAHLRTVLGLEWGMPLPSGRPRLES
jgi:putative transposase